ncbi:MAG: low affinity iron permease family protein [Xanthobacteraceae bacterium]|jgi:low affinity Fe/Cu permease|uniref:low affinity iron permease family protein n=1 Tax=Pseudolabrys sp. TaxID=1960880 RepID=UPI003D14E7C9
MKARKPKPKKGVAKAAAHGDSGSNGGHAGNTFRTYFSKFAQKASHAAGSPAAFTLAIAIIVVWAVCGPIFGYSDTWQLIINTSTTIVTFLMVFLIQNTQNRDSLAVQLKLSELVLAMHGAKNNVATIEELSDDELEHLHKEMCAHTEKMKAALDRRRG